MPDVKMPRTPLGHGNNWVNQTGGLPPRWRAVVRHLQARGYDESRAIATAVNWAKKQCATGRAFGGKVQVSAEAQAAACKEVAQWEAMKAAARATPNKSDLSTSPCTDCSQTVDLAASWDGAKHPRVSKGKSGGGRFTGKQGGDAPPQDVQAQVKDFQRRHGLPQTGVFDPATMSTIHYHASGAAGKAASASKKHAKKVASAAKKAAKAQAAAKKKAAKAAATAAKQKAQAQASAVNALSKAQRAAYRKKAPTPPAGYVWTSDNKLKVAPTAAQKQAATGVAKTLSLSERPSLWRRVIDLGHPHPGQKYKHGWIPIAGVEVREHRNSPLGGVTHYTVHRGDERIGGIDQTHGTRLRAIRSHNEPGVDTSKVKHFGSVESAASWIAKGKPSRFPTPTVQGDQKARISIRATTHGGQTGHAIVGKDTHGRKVSVFVAGGRAEAEKAAANIRAGRGAFSGASA